MGVLPVVAASRGYSPVAMHELPIVAASFVADHRLQGTWSSVVAALVVAALVVAALVVAAHGLSCPAAYGIFRDQESNPCPLHWQVDSYPLGHQGSPLLSVLKLLVNLLLHEADTVIISILQIKKLSHREMRKVA